MARGLTGSGGFISQPLAVVVIGGLLSSTALTLVLVPTLYTMVEKAKERVRRRAGRAPLLSRCHATRRRTLTGSWSEGPPQACDRLAPWNSGPC